MSDDLPPPEPPTEAPEPGHRVRRMTFNLTEPATEALARLPGRDRTDALCKAVVVVDILREYMVGSRLTVLDKNGKPVRVHIVG